MNHPHSGTAGTPHGEASGKHQGLHQPADDGRVGDALDNVGLAGRGETMEDHLRDRRSKGVRNGYDDATDHDPGHPRVEEGAGGPEAPPA